MFEVMPITVPAALDLELGVKSRSAINASDFEVIEIFVKYNQLF
ncbi:MAG: hypothetical protein OXC62_10665 [Aestuariivita sp.]|nr:hypothetical protein [Aestuariivita sp.]